MGLLKNVVDLFRPNPFDQLLKKMSASGKKSFLIVWNRGLGDIALGLYAMVYRIREYIPDARVTFLTRPDLKEGFRLLEGVNVIVGNDWKRGVEFDLEKTLDAHDLSREDFDAVLEKPDPTRWVSWQLNNLVPKLHWNRKWDKLADAFEMDPSARYLGAHVSSETGQHYGYNKDWSYKSWYELLRRVSEEKGVRPVLFGFSKEPAFDIEGIIDLRGETNLCQLLSIVKNRLDFLVVPDSGVLSLTYYINADFPLKMVSLWSDPRQGVLKQNVASPNTDLIHIPLLGRDECAANISVEQVMQTLFS